MAISSLGLGSAFCAELIDLPADPPARRTVTLVEQWRLGGDDEDILLGVITFGTRNMQGQVYLVDRQLSQVLVIGPDGSLVRTLGREGDGPGELRQPHALVMQGPGTVGAIQGFPGRIIGLNADGTPAGNITLGGDPGEGGFAFVRECLRSGDHYVANTGRMVFDMGTGKADLTSTLAVYDLKGALVSVVAEASRSDDLNRRVFDEAAEFSEMNEWTVGADGLVYTTPVHEAYRLTVRNLQGEIVRTLQRPFTPRRRSQADKDELTNGINIVVNGQRQEVQSKTLDRDPAIRDLDVATDGRLFVTNCFGHRSHLPVDTAGCFDVISPDGAFLEELTLMYPGFNGQQDMLFFMDGTHFLAIRNFDSANDAMDAGSVPQEASEGAGGAAEPLEVICLALP
jgi:hypothetical protein